MRGASFILLLFFFAAQAANHAEDVQGSDFTDDLVDDLFGRGLTTSALPRRQGFTTNALARWARHTALENTTFGKTGHAVTPATAASRLSTFAAGPHLYSPRLFVPVTLPSRFRPVHRAQAPGARPSATAGAQRDRADSSLSPVAAKAVAAKAPPTSPFAPVRKVSPFEDDAIGEEESKFNGLDGTVWVSQNTNIGGDKDSKGKYYIHTFGCQMNSADSERMAGSLESMGYTDTSNPWEADVLVYNTCSIRDKAEQKVYSILGEQAQRKRQDPNLKIVIAGCVAQQEGAQLLRRVPELDVVMGPQHANRIDQLLYQVEEGMTQVVATEQIEIMEDIAKPRRESDLTAWVNVIYGCNERCTYCVVPGTRGSEKSRTPEDIKREVYSLGEAGWKEVTLLGQNIDAYGRDLPGFAGDGSGRRKHTFADLLYTVHDAPGIERIRFTTSHPRYFTKRLIKAIAELPKLCEYIHLPVQAGNDKVLREMRRGYTQKKYLEIIADIREAMPDVSIATDLIVGFPGETEEEFQDTLRLYEKVEFDNAFTAAYSPRPHTPAALWDNQVADLIKADRLQRLNAYVKHYSEKRNQRFLGRTVEVLVEGPNPKSPTDSTFGRSRHNKLVFFDGKYEDFKKQLVRVKVTEARGFSLSGIRVLQ